MYARIPIPQSLDVYQNVYIHYRAYVFGYFGELVAKVNFCKFSDKQISLIYL